MGRLAGRVALITGAGRGLGRAMALHFAQEGARVVLASRSPGPLENTRREIIDGGGTAVSVQCDVLDLDAVEPTVDRAVEAFGTVDILVNNAWDQDTALGSVLETSLATLRRQFDSGPISYLRFMQACFPYMDGRDGRVINLASCIGIAGFADRLPYAMAKEAIRALTRTAAKEWGARRVTVNNLLPVADTDAYREDVGDGPGPVPPIPRIGDPRKDIAPLAAFLASPEAAYITGYSFFADGGLSIDTAR